MIEDRRVVWLAVALSVLVLAGTAAATWAHLRFENLRDQARMADVAAAWALALEPEPRRQAPQPAAGSIGLVGFGPDAELSLVRRVGPDIVFTRRLDGRGSLPDLRIPADSLRDDAVRAALAGGAGSLLGRDHAGTRVIAGFAPLPSGDGAVVVTVPFGAISRPALENGGVSALIALLVLALGVAGVARLGRTLRAETLEAEAEARRAAETLELALRSAGQGMFDYDFADDRMRISASLREMFDLEPGQEPRTLAEWRDGFHPQDLERAVRAWEAYAAGETDRYSVQIRRRRADGSFLWVLSTAHIVERGPEGEPLRFVGTYTDIDALKAAEVALARSEQQFRTLAAAAPVGVFLTGADGRATYLNPACARIIGLPEGASAHADWVSRIHPEDRDGVVRAWSDSVEQGTGFSRRYRWLHGDGAVVWGLALAAPVHGQDGKVEHYAGCIVDMTAEVEALGALEERETWLRVAHRVAGLGFFTLNLATNEAELTREASEVFGVAPDRKLDLKELLRRTAYPDDAAAVSAGLQAAARGEGSFDLDHRITRGDGSVRWIRARADLVRDEAGEPAALVGCIFDITERKMAEIALAESEERFRMLAETAPVGIFLDDAEGNAVYLNPECARIIGVPTEEATGRSWEPLLHVDDRDRVVQAWTDAVESGGVFSEEYRWVRPDGDIVWTRGVVVPVRDASGSVSHFVGSLLDFTQEIRGRVELQESALRLRTAQEVAGLGFIEWEFASDTVRVSEETRSMLALGPSARSNPDDITDRVHPEDREALRASLRSGRLGQARHDMDTRLLLPDGRVRWIHTQAELFRDEEGRPHHLLGTVLDITDRKTVEIALEESRRTLEERVAARTADLESANRELESFTYTASHDLRAPLRAIDGYAALVHADLIDADDTLAGRVSMIREQAGRMTHLLDDLLQLSRAGRQELEMTRVNLEDIVRDCFEREQARADGRAIELDLESLPDVRGDVSLLYQVVINVVGNAVKFTSGREHARIEVGAQPQGGMVRFWVKDNGAGFDMAHADKLFVPFQRLHYDTEFPGTGVGLPIVQRIVERHGGRVWAEGEPGVGATIRFTLPGAEAS